MEDSKIVIVQINAAYGYGSTGRTVKEMHEYLRDSGYASYKFYPQVANGANETEQIGTQFDHRIHGFCSRLFGKQAYFSYLATRHLIHSLKKIRPDIVILRNVHSNYLNLRLICNYLASNNIATILVLHDCWFYTGHCFHYFEVGCNKWKTECNHCPLIHSHNSSWLFDNSRSIFYDKKKWFGNIPRLAVVGVSDWITNEAKQSPIIERAKIIRRIYNWIDLGAFYPREALKVRAKYGIREDEFVAIGVAMSWDYHKGMETFIELAKALPDIKIVMIGELPEITLPSNIIKVSRTSSIDELAELYSMADVLLNLSLQESFGKVAAEALACGTPLIVNNATANAELPGDCGYVINNNNLTQIKDAVKSIEKEGKQHYSKRCVERANSLFEKGKNLLQYEQLFHELLKV